MKRLIAYIFILLVSSIYVVGTHNRAGEITYRQISGYTFHFTITTFTYSLSLANRDTLIVDWGDNTYSKVPLSSRSVLPGYYYYNTYDALHTFPGPGVYEILMQDPNRNFGVKNIPNSVQVVFSVKTTMFINPGTGYNNSPVLLAAPVDTAALNHVFIHNPAAFDIDGDSLSYSLAICTSEGGNPISNYEYPEASNYLIVDSLSGDLIWNTPVETGIYNIAMNIDEWRNNLKISNITRDIQIEVRETDNNPPVNPPLNNYCLEEDELLTFTVTSTDPDNDPVFQEMIGGPLILSSDSATFDVNSVGFGYSTSTFSWRPNCNHIRKQPYYIILKSIDQSDDLDLVDIDNFNIRVIGKAPAGLSLEPGNNRVTLRWNQSECNKVSGYRIYRRIGSYSFTPGDCENGIPSGSDYELIGITGSNSDTVFIDDDDGEGLVQGINYCYRITAIFPDGAESYASDEVCTTLIPGNPAMLVVSVTNSDETNGEITIKWANPLGIDTIAPVGPYVCQILRKRDAEEDFQVIDSVMHSTIAGLADTTYIDNDLNTLQYPYYYSVKLFNNTPGNRFQIGENEEAASLYFNPLASDNSLTLEIRKRAPWLNEEYIIYRQNKTTGLFDSIGSSNTNVYEDTGLANGVEYTYQIKSRGWRPMYGSIYRNENLSHIISGIPVDTIPPCPPQLTVISNCDSAFNFLSWTNPNNYCCDDVIKYNIYYSPTYMGELSLLDSINSPEDTTYIHRMDLVSLAGCYYVSAIDSFYNESRFKKKVCVDECVYYELPNVFTPNYDNVNDKYVAYVISEFIEKVNMRIYNRWGNLVFETNNPDIEWDGRYMNTDKIVAPGVYYYICEVYEPRITGLQVKNLTGFIHVYTDQDKIKTSE